MFSVSFRDEVREKIIEKAKSDQRIVSAAAIGSYAGGVVDRWADIDLSFGIDESYAIGELIDVFTDYIENELKGEVLFNVTQGNTIYRVFLLPGCLQVDLSFTPDNEFGPKGPHFKLLFGHQHEKQKKKIPDPIHEPFGLMVHHLLRTKVCAERNQLQRADIWLGKAKNYVLELLLNNSNEGEEDSKSDLKKELSITIRNPLSAELDKEEILSALTFFIEQMPQLHPKANPSQQRIIDMLDDLIQ